MKKVAREDGHRSPNEADQATALLREVRTVLAQKSPALFRPGAVRGLKA
jgi:hypothetical protein